MLVLWLTTSTTSTTTAATAAAAAAAITEPSLPLLRRRRLPLITVVLVGMIAVPVSRIADRLLSAFKAGGLVGWLVLVVVVVGDIRMCGILPYLKLPKA